MALLLFPSAVFKTTTIHLTDKLRIHTSLPNSRKILLLDSGSAFQCKIYLNAYSDGAMITVSMDVPAS